MRWACLAIYFFALGLGEVCTGVNWNLLSEATGIGGFQLVSPAEGASTLVLAHFLVHCILRARMDRHARIATRPHHNHRNHHNHHNHHHNHHNHRLSHGIFGGLGGVVVNFLGKCVARASSFDHRQCQEPKHICFVFKRKKKKETTF